MDYCPSRFRCWINQFRSYYTRHRLWDHYYFVGYRAYLDGKITLDEWVDCKERFQKVHPAWYMRRKR